jgi:hypothetical protein
VVVDAFVDEGIVEIADDEGATLALLSIPYSLLRPAPASGPSLGV